MEQAEQEITKPLRAVKKAHSERLTFKEYRDQNGMPYAKVETGILWIPPFEYDFWSWRRVKPKAAKCTCQYEKKT